MIKCEERALNTFESHCVCVYIQIYINKTTSRTFREMELGRKLSPWRYWACRYKHTVKASLACPREINICGWAYLFQD